MAIDAVVRCEASMCFNQFGFRNTGSALERVDILRKAGEEKIFFVDEPYERVGERRSEFSRLHVAR
jgi:hypothetical protein